MQVLELLNIGFGEVILLLLVGAPFLLTIYCVIDLIRSEFKDTTTKLLFLILVLVVPFIGSVVYLFLKRNYIKQQPLNY